MSELTEEQFLKDIAAHQLTIIRDDGVYRHLQLMEPGCIHYSFDLITWPGHLCVTGDCGTYVYQRIDDMFQFFRMDENDFNRRPDRQLNTNPSYWGEKLLSICRLGEYKRFDEVAFKERVQSYFDDYKEDHSEEESAELWDAIVDDVLDVAEFGDEHAAYQAAHDFAHGDYYFQDFFDGGGTQKHTHHYIWNLYAIVWGIQQYDAFKQPEQVEAAA